MFRAAGRGRIRDLPQRLAGDGPERTGRAARRRLRAGNPARGEVSHSPPPAASSASRQANSRRASTGRSPRPRTSAATRSGSNAAGSRNAPSSAAK